MSPEITPQELHRRLMDDGQVTLLDCREHDEVARGMLPGAIHIPMRDVPKRCGELDPDRETVVYCHSGVRSLRVAAWLQQHAGFSLVRSLQGGIEAWSREIDPRNPRH